jgi:flagellar motor switch protein FliG
MERERNGKSANDAEKDGIRKAALFLSILDAKEADALLARFEPEVARAVEEEARRIGSVPPEDVDAIVAEFLTLSEPEETPREPKGKDERARAKKGSASFDDRANGYRDELRPLDAIKPERLATLLSGASRTTIAVALARLSERRRSAVVALLPTEKAEGARRALAALVRTTDAARRLEDALFNGALDDE